MVLLFTCLNRGKTLMNFISKNGLRVQNKRRKESDGLSFHSESRGSADEVQRKCRTVSQVSASSFFTGYDVSPQCPNYLSLCFIVKAFFSPKLSPFLTVETENFVFSLSCLDK